MFLLKFSFCSLLLYISLHAAVPLNLSLSVSSGDVDFDVRLRAINYDAQQNLPAFYRIMDTSYEMRKPLLTKILNELRFSPADAFLMARCAKISSKTLLQVVETFRIKRREGWNVIVKDLGITPGSNMYRELKRLDTITLKEKPRSDQTVVLRESAGKTGLVSGKK
jgi:hypothetical protein